MSHLLDRDPVVRLADDVVLREFPAETVVLDLRSGRYFSLTGAGGAFVERLTQEPSLSAAVEALQADFDHPREEIERDVREFCADLVERGLLVLDG